MNIPFKFTFAATNDVGALWNPYGVVTGIDVNNTILTSLPDAAAVGLLPPLGSVVMTGVCVMTDDGGDGACSVGYYDTDTSAFVALYPVLAAAVAGGGFVRDLGDGVRIPCGPTKVAAIRYDGATGGVLSGDLRLWCDSEYAAMSPLSGLAVGYAFDENGALLLDESSLPVLVDSNS